MYKINDINDEVVVLGLQVIMDCKDKKFLPEPKFSELNKIIYLDPAHNNFMTHSFVKYLGHTYLIEFEENKILGAGNDCDPNSLFHVSVYFMDDAYGPERIFKNTYDLGNISERRAHASRSFIGFRDCKDLCLELRVQEQSNGCANPAESTGKEEYGGAVQ